jgi:hypothetical protein
VPHCPQPHTVCSFRVLLEKLIIGQLFKENPCPLCNLTIHYYVHKSLPLNPIPRQTNSIHKLTHYFFKVHFNIIILPKILFVLYISPMCAMFTHNGMTEFYLQGYKAMQSVESQLTFWGNMSPPSSGSKYMPSKKPAWST